MLLDAALLELAYAKDWTPQSRAWYDHHLPPFVRWAKEQGVTTIEDVTAPLVRRYIDYQRTRPTKTGKPLDSYTLHGYVAAVRTLLFWAAAEDLIDEKIPKRITPPKREQKVLQILSDEQLGRLFRAAGQIICFGTRTDADTTPPSACTACWLCAGCIAHPLAIGSIPHVPARVQTNRA